MRVCFGVALALVLLAQSSAAQDLVLLSPSAASTSQPVTREVVRQRRVAATGAAQVMRVETRSIRLDLFPDVSLRALRHRLERTSSGMAWYGSIEGYALSDVVFVQVGEELRGTIYTPLGVFRLARDSGGYIVQQLDASIQEPVDDAIVPPEEPTSDAREITPASITPDNGTLIDVMVVYTRDAFNGYGSETAARAAIDLAVAETNQAFRNSLVQFAIRLVHSQAIEYAETGSSLTDLVRLSNRTDGFMDDVHAVRDRVGADLVVLVTESMTDASGRGYLNSGGSNGTFGFSIVARRSMSGRTFAHELGHNMGAHHDWFVETSPGVFQSSKGYTSVEGRFLDVMAYYSLCGHLRLQCVQALQYSNPRTMRDGHRTGVPGGTRLTCKAGDPNDVDCDADAAGALNFMARVVARFRQGVSRALMNAGQHLAVNESVLSDGGAFRLVYQGDGNVVLYDEKSGAPVWATGTAGTSPGRLVMQDDGNLVLYDSVGVARWASGTNHTAFAYLLVQNDGNLVIYSPDGPPIWDRFQR